MLRRGRAVFSIGAAAALSAVACGGPSTSSVAPSEAAQVSSGDHSAAQAALPPPPVPEVVNETPAREVVPRRTIDAVLDAGMGRLLQHVQLEPARVDGRFVGHRVVALDPAWVGAPLEVGDVLVRLNGSTLESPDKAMRALETLRVSSELVIEVLRAGEPSRLRLAID